MASVKAEAVVQEPEENMWDGVSKELRELLEQCGYTPLDMYEKDKMRKILEVQQDNVRKAYVEEYFLVQVDPKQNDEEVEDVPVALHGELSLLRRGKWVPVTRGQLEVLEHAVYPKYKFNQVEHKVEYVGDHHRYPYRGPHPLTFEQYTKLRKMAMKGDIPESEVQKVTGYRKVR